MPRARALPWTDVFTIADNLKSPRDIALFWTLIGTGLRLSEALNLTVSSVCEPNGTLLDYIQVEPRRTSTKLRHRHIPMSKSLAHFLAFLLFDLPNRNPFTYLFLSRKGTNVPITPRQARRILTAAFHAAGLSNGFSPHSLRKTFAQAIFDAEGQNVFVAQQALGHVSPASTVYYLDSLRTQVDAAITNVLDSRIIHTQLAGTEKPANTMPAGLTGNGRLTQPPTVDR